MQAQSSWSAPGGVLGTLVADAQTRAQLLPPLSSLASHPPPRRPPSLVAALLRTDVAVIAEIKRRSPSGGDINPGLSLEQRAHDYAGAGAAALSVLTQPSHFGGSSDDLREASAIVDVPVVRKDFLVDVRQLAEARNLGAAAALLIARAMPPAMLAELAAVAAELGLETLIEVRSEDELAAAVTAGASVIGVNTRNLETLEIDIAVAERLVPLVPGDRPAVFESGVRTRADIERAAACGADAVLVGSALSAAADGAAAVAALVGVPRQGRRD